MKDTKQPGETSTLKNDAFQKKQPSWLKWVILAVVFVIILVVVIVVVGSRANEDLTEEEEDGDLIIDGDIVGKRCGDQCEKCEFAATCSKKEITTCFDEAYLYKFSEKYYAQCKKCGDSYTCESTNPKGCKPNYFFIPGSVGVTLEDKRVGHCEKCSEGNSGCGEKGATGCKVGLYMYSDKEGYNYCETCPNLGPTAGVKECKAGGIPTICNNDQFIHFLSIKDGTSCKRCSKYAVECDDSGDTKCIPVEP